MSEHRVQVQGLSEEDYDKVYRLGYQDGLEQAKYVSDWEVGDVAVSQNDDTVRVVLSGPELHLISREVLENLMRGNWAKVEFIYD